VRRRILVIGEHVLVAQHCRGVVGRAAVGERRGCVRVAEGAHRNDGK
jgi:hypothetical protein